MGGRASGGRAGSGSAAGAETRHRATRLAGILETVVSRGEVDVAALAARFAVTASTVRRDLAHLEEQGLIARTHGGAQRSRRSADELPVRYRDGQDERAKSAIAEAVASRLPPGRLVVGLTGGSTTAAVARALGGRSGLTVVTNALNIAADLAMRSSAQVFIAGGHVRTASYEAVGPTAIAALSRFTFAVAFVGVDGICADGGLTTHDEVEARTNQAMIARAHRVVVVADGRKLGRCLGARMAPVSAAHELVTTTPADAAGAAALSALEAGGLRVRVVRPPRTPS